MLKTNLNAEYVNIRAHNSRYNLEGELKGNDTTTLVLVTTSSLCPFGRVV
jgi:hypothetical protein